MIRVHCANGHRLKVGRKYAGKRVRCPECGGSVVVPAEKVAQEGVSKSQARERKLPPESNGRSRAMWGIVAGGAAAGIILALVLGRIFLWPSADENPAADPQTPVLAQSELKDAQPPGSHSDTDERTSHQATSQPDQPVVLGHETPLEGRYRRFCLDIVSGTVAAIPSRQPPEICLFAPDAFDGVARCAPGHRWKPEYHMTNVILVNKPLADQGVFFVQSSQTLYELSARDLTLNATRDHISSFATSVNPDDPWLYIRPPGRTAPPRSIHMLTGAEHVMSPEVRGFTVSSDGVFLLAGKSVYRRRNPIAEPPISFSRQSARSLHLRHLLAPTERTAIEGTRRQRLRFAAFLPRRRIGIELQGRRSPEFRLQAFSLSENKPVGIPVSFPNPGHVSDESNGSKGRVQRSRARAVPGSASVLVDERRDRVLVCFPDKIRVIPLSAFGLPDESAMTIRIEGPAEIMTGRPGRLELTLTPNTKAVFDNLPDGLTYENGTLAWGRNFPAGHLALTGRLSRDGQPDNQTPFRIDLEATAPGVELPFEPTAFSVGGSGERAVIWGRPAEADEGPYSLTLIDREAASIVKTTQLPPGALGALMAGEHVVVMPAASSFEIPVLDARDLSPEQSIRTQGAVRQITVGDDQLRVMTKSAREVYSLRSLELISRSEFQPTRARRMRHSLPQPLIHTDSGETLVGSLRRGVLLAGDGSPRLLVQPAKLTYGDRDQLVFRTWHLSGAEETTAVEAKYDDETGMTLTGPHVTTSVPLVSIVTPRPRAQRQPRRLQNDPRIWNDVRSGTHRGVYYFLWANRLCWWDHWSLRTTPEIEPTQSTFVIPHDAESVTLKHRGRRGQGRLRYSILDQHALFQLDRSTGAVTVNAVAARQFAADAIVDKLISDSRSDPMSMLQRFDADYQSQQTVASELLGQALNGMPFVLSVPLTITDELSRSGSLLYCVIVDVPRTMLQDRLSMFRRLVPAVDARTDRIRRELRERIKKLVGAARKLDRKLNPRAFRSYQSAPYSEPLSPEIDKIEKLIDSIERQLRQP